MAELGPRNKIVIRAVKAGDRLAMFLVCARDRIVEKDY